MTGAFYSEYYFFSLPNDALLWRRRAGQASQDTGAGAGEGTVSGYKCAYLEARSPSRGALMLPWPHIFYLLWSYVMFSFTSQITVPTAIPSPALIHTQNQAQIFKSLSSHKTTLLDLTKNNRCLKLLRFISISSNHCHCIVAVSRLTTVNLYNDCKNLQKMK